MLGLPSSYGQVPLLTRFPPLESPAEYVTQLTAWKWADPS